MNRRIRYTGELPSLKELVEFPNWEYALDEECVNGQDETTIRPEAQQKTITDDTAYTAAHIRQADGTELMAAVYLIIGEINSIDVYINDRDTWRICLNGSRWEPLIQTWLPENERMPYVSLSDTNIFPLSVETVLPLMETGQRLIVEIP